MTYVLLVVIAGAGGFSAEFNSKEACESARAAFIEDAKGPEASMCVPKG